ncbi:MAG: DUF3597 domain-containing protein [Methylobacter sp.]
MSLINTILDKLGFRSAEAAKTPEAGQPQQPTQAQPAPTSATAGGIPVVDVVAKLAGLAASHPEKLNWKTSIVDLLKLLGLDSSLDARKDLAAELGCPTQLMADSAQMNMWLHKTVLKKLAQNGGNIPPELLS